MAVSQSDPPPPIVHRPAVPHSQMLQPKKLINNDMALPSGAIEETISAADDDIASYPNLKGSKLPALAVKLAKEAVLWGENNEAVYSTWRGGRELPGLPTAKFSKLKVALYSHTPQYWTNIAEFELVWTDCIASIGQASDH